MSYDWLGTFNRSQFQRFIQFARAQLPTIQDRIAHLTAEKQRVGILEFQYGPDNLPTSVTASPAESYIGKLLAAYEVLGGNPFFDLRTRTKEQALFVVKNAGESMATNMSNGEPLPPRGLRDAYTAELVRGIRNPLQGSFDYRYEYLERKIRRALDYLDQLDQELLKFQTLKAAATIEGSLEFLAAQIEQLFTDRNYRAIYDDAGTDPIGTNTYAPFSAYDVEPIDPAIGGPQRRVEKPQRQSSGFVAPVGGSTNGSTT